MADFGNFGFQVFITLYTRIDASAVLGQESEAKLIIRGLQVSRNVHCFTSSGNVVADVAILTYNRLLLLPKLNY